MINKEAYGVYISIHSLTKREEAPGRIVSLLYNNIFAIRLVSKMYFAQIASLAKCLCKWQTPMKRYFVHFAKGALAIKTAKNDMKTCLRDVRVGCQNILTYM